MPMISRRRIIFATVLSCCCLGAADEACSQSDPSASERQETLKLAVIGASASAGFGIVVEVEKASPPGSLVRKGAPPSEGKSDIWKAAGRGRGGAP